MTVTKRILVKLTSGPAGPGIPSTPCKPTGPLNKTKLEQYKINKTCSVFITILSVSSDMNI